MLGNDSMEAASTIVTPIQRRNDIEKSTWRTHRYFHQFLSSNPRRNFFVKSMSEFLRGFAFQNWWNIDELSTWKFDVESMKIFPLGKTAHFQILINIGCINLIICIIRDFFSPPIRLRAFSSSFLMTSFTLLLVTQLVCNAASELNHWDSSQK